MRLIDSHCHLDFPDFDSDREAVLAQAASLGLAGVVVPGVKRETWPGVIDLARGYTGIEMALGLHPMFLGEHNSADIESLDEAVERYKPVAIGEIGLDHYLPELDLDRQCQLFEQQLRIAKKYQLPVILHVRKAHDKVLSILTKTGVCGGIVHAFSGSLQQAERYIEKGFCLGIGGAITHNRAVRLRKMVAQLPLSAMVLETDSPDMAPSDHSGERNTPLNLPQVLSVLAMLKDEEPEVVAETTSLNLERVLGITLNGIQRVSITS